VAIVNNDSQADSAIVLTPKGTGALILGPKPDGTAVGGNARGTQAVDFQRNRQGSSQIASGLRSFIGNGVRNTASGEESIVANGNQCQATGTLSAVLGGGNSRATGIGSVVCGGGTKGGGVGIQGNHATATNAAILGGRFALADRYAMQAHSGAKFSTAPGSNNGGIGDAQRARFVLNNKTTNDTATELFLDGSSTRLTIPSGKIFAFTINISGVKSDGSAVAHYLRQYALKNVSGTTSEVYAPVTIGTDNAAGTSIALSADDTNDALKVEVTGIAAETWRWVASVDAVEIAFGT
jgi:hypothetical protein